tara:strand:- start:22 stop:759 length:738 start_codon:yes stop_codon:yes gene_type:complete
MINLIKGECIEQMRLIPSGSIDAIITDPPYGTTQCKWDSVIDFKLMWEQLNRIIKPNGAIVLFGSEPFSSALRMSNIKNYKYDWVWEKNLPSGMAFAKYQPMRVVENVLVFCNGKTMYNKQPTKSIITDRKIIDGRKNGSGSNGGTHFKMNQNVNIQTTKVNPRNILKIKCVPNAGGYKLHPTQKPVALMEYLIKTYTNENETVLDFTMGSGSTGVAAKNTNRSFIGIELDDNYFDIAKDRINEA